MKRRTVLIGGAALAGAGLFALRPTEGGGMHDPYFAGLSAALQRAGLMHPVLVIDRQRLSANVAAIRSRVTAGKLPLRVVAKSLPAPGLLGAVMAGMETQRLMVFSADMLLQLLPLHPQADYLLGKPLPASEFARVIDKAGAETINGIQWLIDTPERLAAYGAVAKARNLTWRASLEIDVGLHRGGFTDPAAVTAAAKAAASHGASIAGLMGYDPHVPKMPSPDGAFAAAQDVYRAMIGALTEVGLDPARLILNTAGSPTFLRHCAGTVANEVSVGSAFVKPGDFDYDDLGALQPAAFIASPVLKASSNQQLPGVEALSGPLHWWDPNTQRGFFIHGGHWLAKPVSPPGLEYSKLFGRSSNQELLTGSRQVDLKVDDHVFLRPDQSEALFLQFGDIVLYDSGEVAGTWPTLPISA